MSFTIRFEPAHAAPRQVDVAEGTTLLDAALAAGLPVARACGGDALCARCGLVILDGGDALSGEQGEEREAKRRNRVDPRERLACRARVLGPVAATAGYW